MEISFKQYLITEKVHASTYKEILNDNNFRIGFEFEYFDDNVNNHVEELLMDMETDEEDEDDGYNDYEDQRQVMNESGDFESIVLDSFDFDSFPFKNVTVYEEGYENWNIVPDESVELSRGGVEIVSPIMTLSEGLVSLEKVLNYIKNKQ